VRLGDAWRRKKEYTKAIGYLQKALEQDLSNMYVISSLASCYTAMKQYGTAEKLYHLGLKKAPNNPSLLIQLGECLKEQGQIEQAASILKVATLHNPDNKRLKSNLDDCLETLGRTHQTHFSKEVAQSLSARIPDTVTQELPHSTSPQQTEQPRIFRSRKSI
jgi:protein O-GlcNAc transferase